MAKELDYNKLNALLRAVVSCLVQVNDWTDDVIGPVGDALADAGWVEKTGYLRSICEPRQYRISPDGRAAFEAALKTYMTGETQ